MEKVSRQRSNAAERRAMAQARSMGLRGRASRRSGHTRGANTWGPRHHPPALPGSPWQTVNDNSRVAFCFKRTGFTLRTSFIKASIWGAFCFNRHGFTLRASFIEASIWGAFCFKRTGFTLKAFFIKTSILGALCQTKKGSMLRIKKSLFKGIHFFQRHSVSRVWFAC